jgi:hypothetical protein
MSTLGPDPAEGSDVPPEGNAEPTGTPNGEPPTGEETTAAPDADGDDAVVAPTREQPAVTAAADEPTAAAHEVPAVPAAELLVTPAVEEPAGTAAAEEPARIPPMDDPASTPADGMPALRLARRPTLGQAIVMGAGVLLFIWGFLPWYSDAGGSANAWSQETIPGLLLTATWVPLLSLAIAIFVAIKVFADGFPDRVFGFTWPQISMVVGLFGVLISLGFLVANRSLGNLGSLSLGAGLILSLITSLVLLAGGVLDHVGAGTDFFDRPRRPQRPQRRPF